MEGFGYFLGQKWVGYDRKRPKKCHFIGIGGIGMSGLARLMLQNAAVSGSDRAKNRVIRELVERGAKISEGHFARNIEAGMTVVYSSDIPMDNVELLEAKKLGCPVLHRSELLQRLMASRKTLAVAGTHGKTTTSALLSVVLKEVGVDPSYMVGGIVSEYGSSAASGEGSVLCRRGR